MSRPLTYTREYNCVFEYTRKHDRARSELRNSPGIGTCRRTAAAGAEVGEFDNLAVRLVSDVPSRHHPAAIHRHGFGHLSIAKLNPPLSLPRMAKLADILARCADFVLFQRN
jgi:hypothetical protein